jgi:hypothetical protein
MENTSQKSGIVSLTLMSLEAQVKTLFAEAGGKPVVELLDRLCKISDQEQVKVLNIFSNLIDRIISGEIRLPESDSELKNFEDELYAEIINAMTAKSNKSGLKLEVIDGGQAVPIKNRSVVSIKDLRNAKITPKTPVA